MPNLMRVVLSATMYGQLCQNVMHFVDQAPSATTLPDCANAMAQFVQAMRPAVTQQVVWFRIFCTDISNGNAGPFFNAPVNLAGAGNNDSAAQLNATWVLKFDSQIAGRTNRGRIYVPGMSPGFTTFGLVNTAGIAQWQTPLDTLRDLFLLSSSNCRFALCIHGRNDPSSSVAMVKQIDLRSTPGSMRRRMVGVGV